MKERPILFSAPMIRAILNGSKTQTRRIMKRPALNYLNNGMSIADFILMCEGSQVCKFGKVRDHLWVRETWQTHCDLDGISPSNLPVNSAIQYPATYDGWVSKRRPSIHMPRLVSRITLEITGVRVERLQDISEGDALAEGVNEWARGACAKDNPYGFGPIEYFELLWSQINGRQSWYANPFVWVIEFKRIMP